MHNTHRMFYGCILCLSLLHHGLIFVGSSPSQRRTRRIDRMLGHAPTTQIGMRGDCSGGGNNVIYRNMTSCVILQRKKFDHLQSLSSLATGNLMMNTLPFPGVLSTSMDPSCSCIMLCAIVRPNPLPPRSRERAGSAR